MYRIVGFGADAPPALTPADIQRMLQNDDYAGFKAAGAKLAPADRAAMLSAALDELPACYGARVDNCLHGHWDADAMPSSGDCLKLASGYVADFDKFDAAVEALPFCDETRIPRSVGYIAIGAGIAFGVLFGALLS